MIVTRENFESIVQELEAQDALACDCETTGLRPFHGDTFFSIILANRMNAYYFNFKDYPGLEPAAVLTEVHLQELFTRVFAGHANRLWFFFNAKFDLHMLATKNIGVRGAVHECKSAARLLFNDHFDYSLEACAKRIGLLKSDLVEKYILENHLWDWVHIPGKKTREKNFYFAEVPYPIMTEYGTQDGRITYDLGDRQLTEYCKIDDAETAPHLKMHRIATNESALVHTVFGMEQRGVLIDPGYCLDAIKHETVRMNAAEDEWKKLTGQDVFKDSPHSGFGGALTGESIKKTKKGKESFNAEALEIMAATTPLAATILEWRDAKKRMDFFHGFLYHADKGNRIHPNLDPAGTKTGRFSCSQPNLQQLTKDEDLSSAFPVRRAFRPTPGFSFVMLDFDQQEYRIMLDYAGIYTRERRLIEKVLGGLDVHGATAADAGITRSEAKTTNFSILFGAGDNLLAARLKRPLREAKRIKSAVMDAAPEIQVFLDKISDRARQRGYVSNWFGRRWYCPEKKFAYRAPNFICQGGGADVVKVAMNRIEEYFATNGCRSRLVLQVHDELVLEVADNEHGVVAACRKIMEEVYPARFLPLTVGAEWSAKSLADKEDWPGA